MGKFLAPALIVDAGTDRNMHGCFVLATRNLHFKLAVLGFFNISYLSSFVQFFLLAYL